MYLRAVHAEGDINILRKLIQDNPLGILVTSLPHTSPKFPTIQCTHLPWLLDVPDDDASTSTSTNSTTTTNNNSDTNSTTTPPSPRLGKLRGHLARANPHAKALCEAASSTSTFTSTTPNPNVLESEVTVLFTSPAQHYITPKFYVKTKPETGKVVPTWNYAAAQVYGRARVYWDPRHEGSGSFLQRQITDLTRFSETSVMGYLAADAQAHGSDGGAVGGGGEGAKRAWEVSDAPTPFIELLKKSIVGIEVEIDRLEGKFKMSQEMGLEDREGVIDGLAGVGSEVSGVVDERGRISDERKKKKEMEEEERKMKKENGVNGLSS